MKVVAVTYPGGEAAKRNPEIRGAAENGFGLRDFLREKGVEYVVLTDKGAPPLTLRCRRRTC